MKKTLTIIACGIAALLSISAFAAKPSKKAAEKQPEVPVVDYYTQYMNGEDINIAGLVVNKRTYPVCALEKAYELSDANCLQYEDLGVVFLDYDKADGKEDVYELPYNIKPQNKVIIGRYSNHQPRIAFTGTCTIYPTEALFALKNVRVESANYSVNTAYCNSPLNVYIEDCTIITASQHIFMQSNANLANNFESIQVVNSVLSSKQTILVQGSRFIPAGSVLPLKKLELKNSVFTASELTNGFPPIGFRISSVSYFETPEADINIENCTFNNYNSNGYGILSVYNCKTLNFNNNVIGSQLAKSGFLVHVGNTPMNPAITGSVSGNRAYSETDKAWTVEFSSRLLSNSGLSVFDNTCVKEDTPFSSKIKEEKFYIPVDQDKVGFGAGASYTTKLWTLWTK